MARASDAAGLTVADRSEQPLTAIADLRVRLDEATSETERARLLQEIMARQPGTANRMFAGRSMDGNATIDMKDREGRDRLVLAVTPEGQARIRFLDENGNTARELAP